MQVILLIVSNDNIPGVFIAVIDCNFTVTSELIFEPSPILPLSLVSLLD